MCHELYMFLINMNACSSCILLVTAHGVAGLQLLNSVTLQMTFVILLHL